MGFRGMQDQTFFVRRIRDWLKNYRGIRDSNICRIRHWPQNRREMRNLNISRERDKITKMFGILKVVDFHLIAREIEIKELTQQNMKR